MNKLAHVLVTLAFAAACGCLWTAITLLQNIAIAIIENHALPPFVRLCFVLRPVLFVLPLLAAAYCLVICLRKSDGQKSWPAFFATTIYAMVFLGFPVLMAAWLLLFLELVARR